MKPTEAAPPYVRMRHLLKSVRFSLSTPPRVFGAMAFSLFRRLFGRLPAQIACTLTTPERETRWDQWKQLMLRSNPRVAIADNGVIIRFDHPGLRAEVEALVLQERRCCSWMSLNLLDEGRELILTITADSNEGIAVIQNIVTLIQLTDPTAQSAYAKQAVIASITRFVSSGSRT